MSFLTVDFSNTNVIIDLVIGCLLLLAFLVFIIKHIRRISSYIFFSITTISIILSYIFELDLIFTTSAIAYTILLVIALFINITEVRQFLANSIKSKQKFFLTKNINNKSTNTTVDITKLYKNIFDTVVYLSKTKTGALMTFQRRDSLSSMIKTGSTINAPVTPEILQTIFFPGTRLHDGAVIIVDDMIVAASVYYTPTTKPLSGKFGARHRAGLGISELTDSVTVIVSEETGRVSIAYNGELQSVTLDNFLRVFENYMGIDSKEGK